MSVKLLMAEECAKIARGTVKGSEIWQVDSYTALRRADEKDALV